MKELEIIYKILNALRKAMDIEEPSVFPITADGLKISEAKWARLMKMLHDNGYIEGIVVIEVDNAPYPHIALDNPAITLKGLEYLEENSIMKKPANAASGVIGAVGSIK